LCGMWYRLARTSLCQGWCEVAQPWIEVVGCGMQRSSAAVWEGKGEEPYSSYCDGDLRGADDHHIPAANIVIKPERMGMWGDTESR
jgi:hypothetical protein